MRNLTVIIFVILALSSYGQSEKKVSTESNGQWLVTNQFGIATLEAENLFKVNASVFEGLIGREFYLSNKTSLITGIEFLRVRGDFLNTNNQNLFLSNDHINIPLSLRFYNSKENKISIFGGFGIYGSYLLKSEIENILLNTTSDDNGLGFNFGMHLDVGLIYDLDEKWNISLGFKYKSDFLESYRDSNQIFNLTDFYAVQLGLGFKL
ncbi:MAG: outer membrane beta-barrel protein [Winogradskyella sp.]|uniref:outer membrane beta-barrel protein n=1 Tax=Winogradskyella sp. TaxID=1883156 RepID=UPI0017E89794|nr:outer membrane beta-barrel protein [Winogradskyella sp.]MBT8243720.1 PorT family protein [Winogradskyella sp.]NNK22086.1 outer membrane beta-barrel protein [Winogradskyella sp.]